MFYPLKWDGYLLLFSVHKNPFEWISVWKRDRAKKNGKEKVFAKFRNGNLQSANLYNMYIKWYIYNKTETNKRVEALLEYLCYITVQWMCFVSLLIWCITMCKKSINYAMEFSSPYDMNFKRILNRIIGICVWYKVYLPRCRMTK